MTPQLTLNEVLEGAIQKEVFSRFLYVGLRKKMKSQASKDAFKILADQEEIHQHVLEDYLHGKLKEGALSSKQDIDYKIADCLDQPEILPTMDLKDVFLLAAKKEKASHDLYHQLAEIHPEGIIKNLLNELAGQEIEHKQRIETIYTEVAFPQIDGG